FEHAVYSVISPEGCASILWHTADKAADAAEAMKITAADLQALGVVDRIISEPLGGAHRDPDAAIGALKGALIEELDGCGELGPDELRKQRRAKYLAIGRTRAGTRASHSPFKLTLHFPVPKGRVTVACEKPSCGSARSPWRSPQPRRSASAISIHRMSPRRSARMRRSSKRWAARRPARVQHMWNPLAAASPISPASLI